MASREFAHVQTVRGGSGRPKQCQTAQAGNSISTDRQPRHNRMLYVSLEVEKVFHSVFELPFWSVVCKQMPLVKLYVVVLCGGAVCCVVCWVAVQVQGWGAKDVSQTFPAQHTLP
mmetsp:Transcript_7662/g.14688  ORF Transcript_7662/g.14688 Transcript_7662/m.14688 type:complete len:115 (-) Transcript_7662:557-901(-)